MQSAKGPHFSLTLRPEWRQIEAVQQACGEQLLAWGNNADAIDALQMTSAELLENAVKYGYYADDTAVISYSLRMQGGRIFVEVTNPVRETDDQNFRRLDAHIQWIRGFQNAFEAYMEKLKEVSGREDPTSEGGLGLVRIAYEGQAVIDFYINEQNLLSVSAVYTI